MGKLVSRPTPEVVARMSEHGLDYVVMPEPVDLQVAATLDAASGVTQASAADRSTRAWKFDEPAPDDAIDGEGLPVAPVVARAPGSGHPRDRRALRPDAEGAAMNATPNTGRRVAGPASTRGWRPMLVVGLVAMLLTAAALALQAPAAEQGVIEREAPVRQPLTVADVACPASSVSPEACPWAVPAPRRATARPRCARPPRPIRSSYPSTPEAPPASGPRPARSCVHATGATAPGLFAARFSGAGVTAAGECSAPAGETWFVGIGTSGVHNSELPS